MRRRHDDVDLNATMNHDERTSVLCQHSQHWFFCHCATCFVTVSWFFLSHPVSSQLEEVAVKKIYPKNMGININVANILSCTVGINSCWKKRAIFPIFHYVIYFSFTTHKMWLSRGKNGRTCCTNVIACISMHWLILVIFIIFSIQLIGRQWQWMGHWERLVFYRVLKTTTYSYIILFYRYIREYCTIK